MWIQRKSAEQWRYNKLMSEGADGEFTCIQILL